MSQLANLNWMGVLIAFIAYFLLGALWFTLFFSKQYKISLGRENETLPNKPIFIIGPALCTLFVTVTTALLMRLLNMASFTGALEFSLLIGTGYLFANTLNIAINPNMPRPIFYAIISGSYHLLGITLACFILVAMN